MAPLCRASKRLRTMAPKKPSTMLAFASMTSLALLLLLLLLLTSTSRRSCHSADDVGAMLLPPLPHTCSSDKRSLWTTTTNRPEEAAAADDDEHCGVDESRPSGSALTLRPHSSQKRPDIDCWQTGVVAVVVVVVVVVAVVVYVDRIVECDDVVGSRRRRR